MGKVSQSIIQEYKEPSDYVYINTNDPDLQPFRIKLPKPKNIERITGYGLPANDQVFIREQYPMRLRMLEREIRDNLMHKDNMSANEKETEFHKRIWDRLYSDQDKYREILNWIKSQWYYRIYGKWYFINGRPTYLNGHNWFYLNYWHLEQVGYPEYRDRDRKWFLGQEYFMKTTEAPRLDRNGRVMYHPDSTLIMEDTGSKTFYGSNVLKCRQIGDTSKCMCLEFDVVSLIPEGRGGIQAEDEQQSSFVFRRKLRLPVKHLAFFFKPTMKDYIEPSTSLDFSSKDRDRGIDASIDYATTVSRTFYDGENLNYIHNDEPGKLSVRESVKDRHDVVKKCVQKLSGFMSYATTVYEMDTSAGQEFLRLTQQSHFQDRDETRTTPSGLGNMFFPAVEGYTEADKKFIGKFGESVIDTPTREQMPYMGNIITNSKGDPMGAREYLLSKRRSLERVGDSNGLANEKRMNPLSFRDCFTPPAKSQFFDYDIIGTQLSKLQMKPPADVFRGTLEWVGGTFTNEVRFKADKNGRWLFSKRFTRDEANRIVKKQGIYLPNNGYKYVCSNDVFRATKGEGGKMSDGGMTVYRIRDKAIDPDGKETIQYETRQFVCTYLARPSVDEFVEDVLKTCIFTGAWCWPENNITHVEDRFIKWGYKGYLLYGKNRTTGKKNNQAGFNTNQYTKPTMFNKGRDWVSQHGLQCKHKELLEQFNNIRNPDDLTNYDLLAAALGSFLAEDELLSVSEFKDSMQTYDLVKIRQLNYY
ncbi:MAG: hypothetical protein ACOCTU_05825 [Bacteroidota bacterium]